MDGMVLKRYAEGMGIALDDDTAALMTAYGEAVLRKNRVINLTSVREEEDFVIRHLLDSLTAVSLEEVRGKAVDVGTGGGFPGVILKIYKPECDVLLVDSVNKKLEAVAEICGKLGIDAGILHKRAEDMGRGDYRESFDCAVARAVAPLPALLEYCLPLVKKGGHFIAMKGTGVDAELSASETAAKLLGGSLKRRCSFSLPAGIGRTVIVYEKIRETPDAFPRSSKRIQTGPIGQQNQEVLG